jgi:hypothetical protein
MMELRYLSLALTAVAVLGSVWAMKERHTAKVVRAFATASLLGLMVFAFLS